MRSVEVISARGRPSLNTGGTATLPPAAATISSSSPLSKGGKPADNSIELELAADSASNNSSSTVAESPSKAATSAIAEAAGSSQAQVATSISEITPADDEPDEMAASPSQQQQQALSNRVDDIKQASSSAANGRESTPPQQSYAAAAAAGTPAAAANAATAASAAVTAGPASEVAVSASVAPCLLWLEPPAGTTELPTCPVCLERLDEHISGIVTTVRWSACVPHKTLSGSSIPSSARQQQSQ